MFSWMRRLLSQPPDEPSSVVTDRYIVRGEAAGKHLFNSEAGWVEDAERAVVFYSARCCGNDAVAPCRTGQRQDRRCTRRTDPIIDGAYWRVGRWVTT